MYKICVFGGTTEGRKLVSFLASQPAAVTACVATDYGEALLSPSDNVTVLAGRMPAAEIEKLLRQTRFDLVIDATHPYAVHITQSITAACNATDTEYLRLLREDAACCGNALFVADAQAAAAHLDTVTGNILLTTGSKDLVKYTGICDFARRVYARVLPMPASLDACSQAGLPPDHIIAMQGPFSEEMNAALLHATNARWLVTKDGGSAGGFEEKAAAAHKSGVQLVVIGRPPQTDGLRLDEAVRLLCRRFGFAAMPQVTVVGVGPGGRAGMTQEVCDAIETADCLIGAKRMLQAARPGQSTREAIEPQAISDFIHSHPEHARYTVVLSGDTGFFSGAKKLLPCLNGHRVRVLPGVSSLACLCARLQTSYEDVVTVSLHGRAHDIVPDVYANARVFALVGGSDGINRLCTALADSGLEHVTMYIGERLGYEDEKITAGTPHELAGKAYGPLSVALIENKRPRTPCAPGLPDSAFQRGTDVAVPMTKSEVRAVCLSKLQLPQDAVCWDIGAGTGSVAIEMALQARQGRVYAIERKDAAVALLHENCKRFGTANLTVVHGCAPDACRDLPCPTHAFIGGSSGNIRQIIAQLLAKNPLVRIVATAVSLETIAALTACFSEFPFSYTEVVSLNVARDKAVGPYHMMTGQNPIHIFTMQAGCDGA